MRPLNAPLYDALTVYQDCVDSVGITDLKDRLNEIEGEISLAAKNYEEKAPLSRLFQITAFNGKNADIVVGAVTKKELKSLYVDQMVPQSKDARKIYDALKMSSPSNICPYCGFGHVMTLDHYLPKAKYPCLSVLPINLVPSCTDCNTGKSTSVANAIDQQSIHPYFDHHLCAEKQWLFAVVLETEPASVQYLVDPNETFDPVHRARALAHFSDFKLSERYTTQVTNELATLKELLAYDFNINGSAAVAEELLKRATVAYNLHCNSWDTALFQALAASEWYCEGGFNSG